MTSMIFPIAVLSGIGFLMAVLLAVGRRVFAVETDERLEQIEEILPGANCGACGFPGCSGYATALIDGQAKPSICPLGGNELAAQLGDILGVAVEEVHPKIALIACAGDNAHAPLRAEYIGVSTCEAAEAINGGNKRCQYGCLGLGSCATACPFDAIVVTEQQLAVVIPELCTGCGQCLPACPRTLITLVPPEIPVQVLCNNPQKAKAVKAVCDVGCTGCKLCAKQSSMLKIDKALARVAADPDGDIAESTALSCPQGSILDRRNFSPLSWVTDPSMRESHEQKSSEWKAAEKERKAKAKRAKKEAAQSKGEAQ